MIKELIELEGMELLETLIEYGKDLPKYPKELLTEQNKIKGCISETYINCKIEKKKLQIQAYSDALIIKGYLFIIINEFKGISPSKFLQESEKKTENLIHKIQQNLTPTRAKTVKNIIQHIITEIKLNQTKE